MGVLVVVDGLSTSFDVRADAVVVAGRECLHIVEAEESDGIFWGIETDGTSVPSDVALGDVVSSLYANKETVTANHGVSGERWSLDNVFRSARTGREMNFSRTLKKSRAARVWKPDCLYAAFMIAVF